MKLPNFSSMFSSFFRSGQQVSALDSLTLRAKGRRNAQRQLAATGAGRGLALCARTVGFGRWVGCVVGQIWVRLFSRIRRFLISDF